MFAVAIDVAGEVAVALALVVAIDVAVAAALAVLVAVAVVVVVAVGELLLYLQCCTESIAGISWYFHIHDFLSTRIHINGEIIVLQDT